MTPGELLIQGYLENSLSEAEEESLRTWLAEDVAHVDKFTLESFIHYQLRDVLADQKLREDCVAAAHVACQVEDLSAIQPPIVRKPTEKSPKGSTVLGLLRSLQQVFGEAPAAAALVWLAMACVCSGIVLTIAFCGVLVFRGLGANAHGEGPAVRNGGQVTVNGGQPQNPADASGGNPQAPAPDRWGTVARLIHAAGTRWASGSHPPRVTDDLEPGRKLVLRVGLAEIMFQSGVRVVLQGPAVMEIDSRNGATLRLGKASVSVENPDARGFAISAPGMLYTDLGTEFAVLVANDGSQEMQVFRGKVQAEAVADRRAAAGTSIDGAAQHVGGAAQHMGSEGAVAPLPGPVLLTANQALRVAGPERAIERIDFDEKRFVRTMPAPVPFALVGTGVGREPGDADSHWEITKISGDVDFKPQPAVVANPLSVYMLPEPGAAQWVSKSQVLEPMPEGCRWTFCTRFDLTGFDPTTARITGRLSVDDYVAEIRVNGRLVPLPAGSRRSSAFTRWIALEIDEGFVDGENTLEIVIENARFESPIGANVMALCVDLKGIARPSSLDKGMQ